MSSFSAMKPPEDNERIMIDSMPVWRGGVGPTDWLIFLQAMARIHRLVLGPGAWMGMDGRHSRR
jgi:hypothetical protein